MRTPLNQWFAIIAAVISLLISMGTLVYAAKGVRQSKLSAVGALRSATAAETQVELSRSQVADSAESANQAKESAEMSRLGILEAARQRIHEQSPKPLIVIDRTACRPVFGGDPVNFPDVRTAEPALDPMDFWECRFRDVYYPIRGTLVNEGSESFRVALQGVTFTSASSKLCANDVAMPPIANPFNSMYLLRPGEMAVFDWWAGGTLDNWVDAYNGDERCQEATDGTFICFPGTANSPVTYIILRLYSKPPKPDEHNANSWIFPELNPPSISINWKRQYHEDTKLLRQELTGEYWDGRTFWPKQR